MIICKPGRMSQRGALFLACWIAVTAVSWGWAEEGLEVRNLFDARVPMRDGVTLSADIWLPLPEGRYPVLLMRTPYLKTMARLKFPDLGHYFASRGYVLAVQDVRGRGDSDGEFGFLPDDNEDGYDTVEWLARQPWSSGRVGMLGVSYLGSTQWMAARSGAPSLVGMVPTASGGFDAAFNYSGGALLGWTFGWTNVVQSRIYQGPNTAGLDMARVEAHRPLITRDEVFGRKMPLFRAFLEHPDWDPYWESIQFGPETYAKIDVPALHVAGWFDGDQPSAVEYWKGMRKHSPARDRQHLLLGPWTHRQTFLGGVTKSGEMEFSPDAVVDNRALHLAFFDHYLRGSTETFDFPRARVYVMGDNRWRDLDDYPPPQATFKKLYFHSRGQANTLFGDGTLSWRAPAAEPIDNFTYDPKDPVPVNSPWYEPVDQRPIERREDVLVYTSEVLEQRVEVIGNPFVELYAASDARDTDFTAKIVDVYPDGRAIGIGAMAVGVIRARFRNGYQNPQLLEPGKVEKYRILLRDMAHTFLPGHQVRIEISSSAYPFIVVNQNTGNPIATDTEWRVAHQTVYHQEGYGSHVALPVMPRE